MNWHCYLLGMYDATAVATLLNLVSARWLHNNTHRSAEYHVNARTAFTWWCCWGVLCGVSAGFRQPIVFLWAYIRTYMLHSHTKQFGSLFQVLLVTITSRELWLPRPPDEPVRFLNLIPLMWWPPNNASKWQMGFDSAFKGLMVGHVEG
jgi:hypothetical protein